jgi:multidrug efflux system membrane fusion protein
MNYKSLTALAVLLAVGGYVGYNRYLESSDVQAAQGAKGPAEQAVSVVPLKVEDVPVRLDLNGSVASLKTVEVRAQTSNLIKKIHVKEGQFVKQGELLFSLDDRADRANLERLKAQLARDQALVADYLRQYKRAQELRAQNFIAASALDTSQAQYEAQLALVKADEAALQAAQVTLDFDSIVAPQSGRLGGINVFAGSLVQPSGAALVTITQLDPIAVQFSIPEASLSNLQRALSNKGGKAPVRVTLPGTTQSLTGHLYFADSMVDAATGTLRAKAEFANPNNLLWPGQFVQTSLQLDTLKGVTTMPSAALVTNINGKFVYVLGEGNTAQQKPVKVLYTYGERMAIEGLKEDEQVILDGKQNLRPGVKVRLISAKPPVAKAEAANDKAPAKP